MKTETQLTAVEWLEVQIKNTPTVENLMNQLDAFIKEANTMFEEQIIDTYKKAQVLMVMDSNKQAEQYYNETFKSE